MKSVRRNFQPTTSNFFPTLFNEFFADDFYTKASLLRNGLPTNRKTVPAVNIKNEEEHYIIELVAAGFGKSDFQIEFNENKLTIEAKIEESKKEEKETYSHKEFARTAFKRTFLVDAKDIDADGITASYEAGVLTVQVPKQEKEITKRKIEIN